MRAAGILGAAVLCGAAAGCGGDDRPLVVEPPTRSSMKLVSLSNSYGPDDSRLVVQMRNDGGAGAWLLVIEGDPLTRDTIVTHGARPIDAGATHTMTFLGIGRVSAVHLLSGATDEPLEYARTDCRVLGRDESPCA